MYLKNLIIIFLILFQSFNCNSYSSNLQTDQKSTKKVLNYMEKFGYFNSITNSNKTDELAPESLSASSPDQFTAIIKNIQRFGNIEESGILDESTLKLIESKRCGCPDFDKYTTRSKRYVLSNGRWHKKDFTYYLQSWDEELGRSVIQKELNKAFKIWSDYGRISFTEILNNEADIVIIFGNDPLQHFDGPGGVVAHAYSPAGNNPIGGDIYFDKDENWITKQEGDMRTEGTDFFTVAVHEIGHSLGLRHTDVPGSVMNPYYKPNFGGNLGSDDIYGIYKLFIADSYNFETSQRPLITKRTTTSTTTSERSTITMSTTTPKNTTTHHENEFVTSLYPFGCHKKNTSRRKHQTEHSTPRYEVNKELNICTENSIDAITEYRGEIMVFKDQYFWRLNDLGNKIIQDKFQRLFKQIPNEIDHIDSAYHNKIHNTIVLFSGKLYWEFFGQKFYAHGTIQDLGIPSDVSRIQAATEWSDFKSVILISGNRVWILDQDINQVKLANKTEWNLDLLKNKNSAFAWTDNILNIIENQNLWKLNSPNDLGKLSRENLFQYVFHCR